MQRVRVGLTGLGAVLLIVAISAVMFETASQQPAAPETAVANQVAPNVATMVGNETADEQADPLTEIGVTPSGPASPATGKAAPEPGR